MNDDRVVNALDIDLLCGGIRQGDPRFDLESNDAEGLADFDFLVASILGTSIGDSNLDGVFDSRDFVAILQVNEYEDGIEGNSTWGDGDWNCDAEFSTRDLVHAFQNGSYSEASVALMINPAVEYRLASALSRQRNPYFAPFKSYSRLQIMRNSPLLVFLMVCTCWEIHAQTTNSKRRDPVPQVRYDLGPDSLPQDGVPKGKLEGPHLFHSDIIKDTVRKYWVYVPAQYNPDDPACVLVFQDGARAINPNGAIRVPQVLENLIAKNQIPVTIGIFITPGQRGDEFPDSIGTGNPDNRDREYDVLNDKYARMLIEEILPEVGKKYNLTKDAAGRAIGGSSSGGICAFTVAWERPEEFRNVISFIGSFTNIHGGHVYPDLVRQEAKKPIRIFLQDGVNDLRRPDNLERDWHIQNQKMVAAFKEKDYDMAYVFGEGGHSDDHGGAMLPHMLRWIWRDYPGVETPTEDQVAEAAKLQPKQQELFPGFDANAKVDPSGTWTWERRFGRFATTYKVSIEEKDGKLTGTCETQRGEAPATTIELANPVLDGNKLIFDLHREFNGRPFTVTYQGIVVNNEINGWAMMEFRGNPRDSRWSAKR